MVHKNYYTTIVCNSTTYNTFSWETLMHQYYGRQKMVATKSTTTDRFNPEVYSLTNWPWSRWCKFGLKCLWQIITLWIFSLPSSIPLWSNGRTLDCYAEGARFKSHLCPKIFSIANYFSKFRYIWGQKWENGSKATSKGLHFWAEEVCRKRQMIPQLIIK